MTRNRSTILPAQRAQKALKREVARTPIKPTSTLPSAFQRLVLGLAPDPFDEDFSGRFVRRGSSKRICEHSPPNDRYLAKLTFSDPSALNCIVPPIKVNAAPGHITPISHLAILTFAALVTGFNQLRKATVDLESLGTFVDRFGSHLKSYSDDRSETFRLDLGLALPELEQARLLRGVCDLSCSDTPTFHSLELLVPLSEAMRFIGHHDPFLTSYMSSCDNSV